MATSGSVLEPGRNRFAFALFDRTRRQIGDTPAAIYVAPEGGAVVELPYPAEYRLAGGGGPIARISVVMDADGTPAATRNP